MIIRIYPRILHTALTVLLVTFSMGVRADFLKYTSRQPLIFGMDRDYPPLEYVDDDGDPSGLDIKFTQELMRRMNIPYTYSPNSWENISDDVFSGRVDLGMMVYSPYRKDLTNYSKAVFRLYYQVIYRKDSQDKFDMRNLSGKSVAFLYSRPIKDTLSNAGAILNVVPDLALAVIDLSAGRYDAVICFRYQSNYIIDKYKLTNLMAEDLTLTPREYCYVSHDKQLIDSINAQLRIMEAEGVIQDIYGDVSSTFGSFQIPEWVWMLVASLVFLFMALLLVFQQIYSKRLKKEVIRAHQSEQLKTVFLGNISHALRTPLNSIIGFSDVLDADTGAMSKDDQHELLQIINSNGKQLLYFINELLELSKIEGNELEINRHTVHLKDTMDAYVQECRRDLSSGVMLHLVGEDYQVMIDEHYLRIVTKHLLTNAINHTKRGSVTLSYAPMNKGLYVEVKDTGEGLPEALRGNIFSLLSEKATFVQNDVPGLGLTICKAIVDRCKGKMGADSPEEGGTVVWYWIPLKE